MCPHRLWCPAIFCAHLLSWATAAFTPIDRKELQSAVQEWLENHTMAEAEYGHISLWDTRR
eukprot:2062260-Amphidinium_carterae.1